MIIWLTGRIAAWKWTVVELLLKKWFKYFTMSQAIREEVSLRGLDMTRENITFVANYQRKKFWSGYWVKKILSQLDLTKNYIIDGVRNPGEVTELKNYKDFFLISIDADQKIRFQRVLERSKESDSKTWEWFIAVENKESWIWEEETWQQVTKAMEMADYQILNNWTLEELSKNINNIIDNINFEIKNLEDTINIYNKSASIYVSCIGKNYYEVFEKYLNWKKLLDIWCWVWTDMKYFYEKWYDINWVDISKWMIDLSPMELKDKIINYDITKLDKTFQPETFDWIWSVASIVHMSKNLWKKVINNSYKILKKWGIILIVLKLRQDGQPEEEIKESISTPWVSKRYIYYSKYEMEAILSEVWFKILWTKDVDTKSDKWIAFIWLK